jgi:hypothetical protein
MTRNDTACSAVSITCVTWRGRVRLWQDTHCKLEVTLLNLELYWGHRSFLPKIQKIKYTNYNFNCPVWVPNLVCHPKRRMEVCEDNVLKRTCRSKTEGEIRTWIKLHKQDLHNTWSYSSLIITGVNKSRTKTWVRHVERTTTWRPKVRGISLHLLTPTLHGCGQLEAPGKSNQRRDWHVM